MSPHSPSGLFDTGVLRDIRISHAPAVAFILSYIKTRTIFASELSAMMLFAETLDLKGLANLRVFLGGCTIHSISSKISKRAYS